ncbi:MAG: exo-alpha-sialidase [Planctomycetota bacterium]
MPRQILISTRKGLFVITRKGRSWQLSGPEFRGVPVSMALFDGRDGSCYAALDHGHFGAKLHRRVGRKWNELPAPVYPQLKKGKNGKPKVEKEGGGRPWPRSLRMVWSLEVDPRSNGGLWCGTIPGGLFHSADAGASWQFNDGLWNQKARKKWFGGGYDTPGIHSVLVDPRAPDTVTVGISCGGVWRTTDGGSRWQNIAQGMRAAYVPREKAGDVDTQDPHRLAQCAADPDRIWCQHHNGIFRTQSEGKPWREVRAKAPSRFGFAVAAHPGDPDTAWFVPAQKDECRVPVDGKLVVLRTSNGGRSFDVLTKGLPQQHAYDLVWRHGLDVSADGQALAMGATSGRLWLSEDGGEGWREFAANLPPIHAVRWIES